MKHLFFYIVSLFLFFNASVTKAEVNGLPEDLKDTVVEKILQKNTDDEENDTNLEDVINFFAEISHYFYKNYTIEQMSEEDFIEKLRPFFPQDDDYDLQEKQALLINGVSAYEKGMEFYKKLIEKFMMPQNQRRVRDESEFDHPDEVPYIEAEKGHFIKVYNFKKFLTYSNDLDEVRAIADFEETRKNPKGLRNTIKRAAELMEWKKIPFYGTVFKNPLLSDLGISQWQKKADVSARLISQKTYIDNEKELNFGIQIKTEPFTFIPANNLSPDIQKPLVTFDKSENLESTELIYPVPLNTIKHPEAHKYFGDFMLPVKIKVSDVNKPLVLRAEMSLSSCDNDLNCSPLQFELEQMLEPEGKEIFENGFENYFYVNNSIIPYENLPELNLNHFVADSDENGQFLRLEFKTEPSIKSFKVFVEDKEGYILFSAPLVSLQDNKIYVRLNPLDKNADLKDKLFQITAMLNNRYPYRSVQKADEPSFFDPDTPTLNLGLLLFALLGGFILNFMPCVFPVLSMKIIGFSRIKPKHRRQLKQNLYSTVGGIFSGFTLLILMLLICKYMGYSLGWGMQFQSMTFLIIMTFVVLALAITMPSISADSLSRLYSSNLDKKTGFIIGNLTVLLSTPCTAPYLATAVGFALSGGYLDIIAVMYAVALGISLPYIIILLLKNPESFFPKPGKWMNNLAKFMHFMLYVTVVWLLSLIFGQTDRSFMIKFLIILLVFWFILYIYRQFLEYLDGVFDERVTIEQINTLRKQSYVVIGVVFALIIAISANMAQRSYSRNLKHNLETRQTFIDRSAIEKYLHNNRPVLLEIGADWCLTCHVNNALAFNKLSRDWLKQQYNIKFIKVDWTNYNKEILDFMGKYGRKGLPFYILYTPLIREGLVLPEMFDSNDLSRILDSSGKY